MGGVPVYDVTHLRTEGAFRKYLYKEEDKKCQLGEQPNHHAAPRALSCSLDTFLDQIAYVALPSRMRGAEQLSVVMRIIKKENG